MSISNLVSVFVGGAQKSGTRSISHYFRQHNNIAVQIKKESHFFDRSKNFSQDIPLKNALEEYQNNFSILPDTKVLCDVTPDYIFRKNAVKRIYNYNPKAKWIILLRNPIERAYSSWNMEVNRNTENLSFEDALQSELQGNPVNRSEDRFLYLGRSQYYKQLLNLWKYFPKSQCQIYSAELVWDQPAKILNNVLKLINIPINNGRYYEHIHKGTYEYELSTQARALLIDNLHFELNDLPSLLEWETNPWNAS